MKNELPIDYLKHRLTIRKINKKYFQAGYYEDSKWINVKHLGTAYNVVRQIDELKRLTHQKNQRTKIPP